MNNDKKIDYVYQMICKLNKMVIDKDTTQEKLDFIYLYFKDIEGLYMRGDKSRGHGF